MVKFYRYVLFTYWLLITLLALIPVQQSDQHFLYSDKILHFLSFFILLFLFDRSFEKPITLATLLALFGYGILIELAQALIETRSSEIFDLIANAFGLLVYFFFAPRLKSRNKIL